MKQIATLVKLEKPKFISKRAELIQAFVDELNLDRGTGYFNSKHQWVKLPKLTAVRVNMMTAHLKFDDLLYLWSICKSSRTSFGKTFFGSLKVKK